MSLVHPLASFYKDSCNPHDYVIKAQYKYHSNKVLRRLLIGIYSKAALIAKNYWNKYINTSSQIKLSRKGNAVDLYSL